MVKTSRNADASRPTALVAGNYRPSLAAARELQTLGYRVLLGAEPGSTGAEFSRFVDEVWELPDASLGEAALRSAVRRRIAADPTIRVVLPMTEQMLDRVAAIRDAFPPDMPIASPQSSALKVCHDKFEWLRFSRDAGVETPPFATAETLVGLREAVETVGCPVVIRPVEAGKRIGKRKAITIRHADELAEAFPTWPEGLRSLLVQRRFEGDRYNIYYGAQDGVIVRELHSRSIRTDRWDGSGQTIEGKVVAPVARHTEMLAQAAGALRYTGIGCAQFLYDPATDQSCFLEINPRFGASYVFVERAGFELTRLALELAEPSPAPTALARPVRPTRFVWTFGDLSGLAFSIRSGDVSAAQAVRWAATAMRAAVFADVHVTWSWSDPLPTIRFYLGRLLGRRGARTAAPAKLASDGAPDRHV